MTVSKLAVAATLLFASACQQSTAPAPEYHPEKAGTVDQAMCLLGFLAVPLREVSTGHHLVEATINNRSAGFVLDTGANMTVINQSQAGQFGISDQSSGFSGRVTRAVGGRAGGSAV